MVSKCLLFSLLAAIMTSVSAKALNWEDLVCPNPKNENAKTPVVLHPHPTNCSKFFYCAQGKLVPFDCPSGLRFNPRLDVCDWPRNVDCPNEPSHQGPHKPTTRAPAQHDSADCEDSQNPKTQPPHAHRDQAVREKPEKYGLKCPNPKNENAATLVVLHPHPTSCSKFFYCAQGDLVLFDCPDGLDFNPKLNVCDWPSNVKCSHGTQAPTKVTPKPTKVTPKPTKVTPKPTKHTKPPTTEDCPEEETKPQPTEEDCTDETVRPSPPTKLPPTEDCTEEETKPQPTEEDCTDETVRPSPPTKPPPTEEDCTDETIRPSPPTKLPPTEDCTEEETKPQPTEEDCTDETVRPSPPTKPPPRTKLPPTQQDPTDCTEAEHIEKPVHHHGHQSNESGEKTERPQSGGYGHGQGSEKTEKPVHNHGYQSLESGERTERPKSGGYGHGQGSEKTEKPVHNHGYQNNESGEKNERPQNGGYQNGKERAESSEHEHKHGYEA